MYNNLCSCGGVKYNLTHNQVNLFQYMQNYLRFILKHFNYGWLYGQVYIVIANDGQFIIHETTTIMNTSFTITFNM